MEGPQGRAAAAILGVALGDAMGLPFEFQEPRRQAYLQQPEARRAAYLREQIVLQLTDSVHSRVYSDDTVTSDLKMAAYAEVCVFGGRNAVQLEAVLLRHMLRWCYLDSQGTPNRLFQGTGGHTRGFLSLRKNLDLKAAAAGRPLCSPDFYPLPWYFTWVRDRWAGVGSAPRSYGNGAVMSAAPAAAANALWGEDAPVLAALACTHQAPDAQLAHAWLLEVLAALLYMNGPLPRDEFIRVVSESYHSCALRFPDLPADPCYAAEPFLEYCACLQQGVQYPADGLREVCLAAVGEATDPASQATGAQQDGLDAFGQLLGRLARVQRAEVQPGRLLHFSQRGLNTVAIAFYCVLRAQSLGDVMHLVLGIGGDTDTVGAVAMSVAGAMYGLAATSALFGNMVGLESVDISQHLGVASALRNARTLAHRYEERARLFVLQNFGDLVNTADTLSLTGLEEPTWTLNNRQLRFLMNGEGRYRTLAADFPFDFVVDGLLWRSVEDFALSHACHAAASPNAQADAFQEGLEMGLRHRLVQDAGLQACLLATGRNALVPIDPRAAERQSPLGFRPEYWALLLMAARSELQAEREHRVAASSAEDPLSNWFPLPDFLLEGRVWPSVEHYVQAQKFEDEGVREEIRRQRAVARAVELGRRRHPSYRRDWGQVRADVAWEAMRQKFRRYDALAQVLTATAPKGIAAEGDEYWGVGAGQGRNVLGRLLMCIRDALLDVPIPAGPPSQWEDGGW